MSNPKIIMVPRDQTVADLINQYADGKLSYRELETAFAERGWSAKSLYENVRHLQ